MPSPDPMTYAIGDVHGRADLLARLQVQIAADAAASGTIQPTVVYLGDYVDRGPDSKAVLDLVLNGLPEFRKVTLLGNHDDMLRSWLDSPSDENTQNFFRNGGLATMASYGVNCSMADALENPVAVLKRVAACMPAEHRHLLDALEPMHEDGWNIFAHAGLNPDRTLAGQTVNDLTWIRRPFLESSHDWGRRVVHGHTPDEFGPQLRPNRIGVDTLAYKAGNLTAVALQAGEPRFLVSAQRCKTHIIMDPDGSGGPEWRAWALAAAASAGVVRLGLCVAQPDLVQVECQALGLGSKVLKRDWVVEQLADPGSKMSSALVAKTLAFSFPGWRTADDLQTDMRLVQLPRQRAAAGFVR